MEKWKKYLKENRHSRHNKRHNHKHRRYEDRDNCVKVIIVFVNGSGSKCEKVKSVSHKNRKK